MKNKPETQQPEPPASNDSARESVSGVQIVRSNTPRPPSPGQAAHFPIVAPAAPPLPEELSSEGEDETQDKTPLPLATSSAAEPEFLWLFEYGTEMDAVYLNDPERLDGLALLYGPAVLHGYTITFDVVNARGGQVSATIVPSRTRGAEVWGMLYRLPSRAARASENAAPILDRLHSAAPPDGLFERLQVTVREVYRSRDIECITYIASTLARNEYHLLPRHKQAADEGYLRRLVETARRQKLPDEYVRELAQIAAPQPAPVEMGVAPAAVANVKHNTEPLPAVTRAAPASPVENEQVVSSPPNQRGVTAFALYMVVMLVVVLIATVSLGPALESNFISPGVPWFILMYGFTGGCASSIILLGRQKTIFPPEIALIAWFTRPFIGAVLALIAYLLLNSGLIVLGGNAQQHAALFSLVALAAGACENWLFNRRG